MSTMHAIREAIARQLAGKAFTPTLFAGMGSRAAIDMALMREVKSGKIERVGRGVYVVAKKNRFGQKVMPAAEQVAKVVAKGAVVGMSGAEAARQLGFSTQMPTQPIFYTSGPSRVVKIGNTTITLRHQAPRKLALAGKPAGVALSALWYLGKEEVTAKSFKRIAQALPREEFAVLRREKSKMPGWMAEALNTYETEQLARG